MTGVLGGQSRFLEAAWLLLGITLLSLWSAPDAGADHHPNLYSYRIGDENCSGPRIDPIGLLFYGKAARTGNLAGKDGGSPHVGHLTAHRSKWTRHESDNFFRQRLRPKHIPNDTYFCDPNGEDTDLATAPGAFNDRGHLRMWHVPEPFAFHHFTWMTPHMEFWSSSGGCDGFLGLGGSHVVYGDNSRGYSGFDRARRRIAAGFRANHNFDRHPTDNSFVGNTDAMRQCNGGYAASNGTLTSIKFGESPVLGGGI